MSLRPLFFALTLASTATSAQSPSDAFDDLAEPLHAADRDSMVHVDRVRFDALVGYLDQKLTQDSLANLSDADHINLMRVLNTIMFEQRPDERFHGGPYQRLEDLSWSTDYRHWAADNLGGWIPNRGMGFYFPKLDMELEGTPTLHGRFNVR